MKKTQIAAVIDIGSNKIRLKIGQNNKGTIKQLESLAYPASLGRDTFNKGKISFEKADNACEIIKNFIKLSSEYGVDKIRVIATSAIREATNKDYILNQIRLKTGLNVEILDNLDEKNYLYKLLLTILPKELNQSSMMVYIGSGSVGVSIVQKEKIPLIQNIKVGSLRLSELFGELHDYSREFYKVVEDYVKTFTNTLESVLPFTPKNFITSGNEISLIAQLCKAEKKDNLYYIHKDIFDTLYDDIKTKTVDLIMDKYNISLDKAELLLPTMCIFNNLLRFSATDTIIAPINSQLSDAVMFEMLQPADYAELSKSFYKNCALSSRRFAEKFACDRNHYTTVEKFALKIFDKLKKVHGLSAKERLLLQSACILHDCGKIISLRAHYKNAYNIIRSIDIVGLNIRDLEIIACVSLYHSRIIPTTFDPIYNALNETDRVVVSKIASILRIADALDRSQTQKFDEIDVKLDDEKLIISISSEKNTELEEWAFKEKALFFEEVFGFKTKLKKKKVTQ